QPRLRIGEFLFETQESRFFAGDRVANRLSVERRRSHGRLERDSTVASARGLKVRQKTLARGRPDAVCRTGPGAGRRRSPHWRTGGFTATGASIIDMKIDIDKLTEAERSEEHTSELQSRFDLVCRLLLEKKKL